MNEFFKRNTYLISTLDPVHIGTGGYRMDRVDNTIVRDVDGLPKIPGSSLSGAIRSYAALKNKSACGREKKCSEKEICAICETFGYTSDTSRKGLASFYDVRILLFPVATMVGPVWITTYPILEELEQICQVGTEQNEPNSEKEMTITFEKNKFVQLGEKKDLIEKLNVGWVMLEKHSTESFPLKNLVDLLKTHELTKNIFKRIILVHPDLFVHLVNDNLEVRTSVSINPLTGAAEDGALFTYEAIPRSTIMWFDIVISNPNNYANVKGRDISFVEETVQEGISLLEPLGVGGMTTRGFGRIRTQKFQCKGGDKE